jgi:hypothetical protein
MPHPLRGVREIHLQERQGDWLLKHDVPARGRQENLRRRSSSAHHQTSHKPEQNQTRSLLAQVSCSLGWVVVRQYSPESPRVATLAAAVEQLTRHLARLAHTERATCAGHPWCRANRPQAWRPPSTHQVSTPAAPCAPAQKLRAASVPVPTMQAGSDAKRTLSAPPSATRTCRESVGRLDSRRGLPPKMSLLRTSREAATTESAKPRSALSNAVRQRSDQTKQQHRGIARSLPALARRELDIEGDPGAAPVTATGRSR